MEIDFHARHREADALRTFAERRLRFVVRRLAWYVARASVTLSGNDGTRPARRCRVELVTHDGRAIVVTAVAQDFTSALDSATKTSGHALVRAWARTPTALTTDRTAAYVAERTGGRAPTRRRRSGHGPASGAQRAPRTGSAVAGALRRA